MRLGNDTHPGPLLRRQRTAAVARQQRLGIERIQMRRAAEHEQHDDPLHLRGVKCGGLRRQRIDSPPRDSSASSADSASRPKPAPSCEPAIAAATAGARRDEQQVIKRHRPAPAIHRIPSIDINKFVGRQQSPAKALPGQASAPFPALTGQGRRGLITCEERCPIPTIRPASAGRPRMRRQASCRRSRSLRSRVAQEDLGQAIGRRSTIWPFIMNSACDGDRRRGAIAVGDRRIGKIECLEQVIDGAAEHGQIDAPPCRLVELRVACHSRGGQILERRRSRASVPPIVASSCPLTASSESRSSSASIRRRGMRQSKRFSGSIRAACSFQAVLI